MIGRENFPLARWNAFPDYACMQHDPFISGLRRYFEEHPDVKPATVSRQAGLDVSTIRKLLKGDVRTPKRENAERIASQLGMTVDEIVAAGRGDLAKIKGPTVAVPGFAGAGDEVDLMDDYAKGDGMYHVACPPQLSPHGIVALEIRGDSMEPVYQGGGIIFYTRDAMGVPNEAAGKICIAEDADGKVWLKHVKLGGEPGLYHLISLNQSVPPMYDRTLKWAAPIRFYLPPDMVDQAA